MSEELKKNLEHLKDLGKKKKQQQAIKMIPQSQLDEQADDEDSYDSEDEYSEENDLEEYMMHMDEQILELKEMII